jgi:hypothetical protein
MKIFNSFQELWKHAAFCPLCRKECREVKVSVGPEDVFKLISFQKDDTQLTLECAFHFKKKINHLKYEIDCLTNSLRFSHVGQSDSDVMASRASKSFSYFCLNSRCAICDGSYFHSADIHLAILENKITNVNIDREGVYLTSETDNFHITTYGQDFYQMTVGRWYMDDDGVLVDEIEEGKMINLPEVNFDFIDQAKVIEKIKFLILFS